MPTLAARAAVHARQLSRTPAARTARRAVRLATKTIVLGVAPSLTSDAILTGKPVDALVATHELATSALATTLMTAVHDVGLLLRLLAHS